jgi:hypothetical protein
VHCSPGPTLARPNSLLGGSGAGSRLPGAGELPWRTGAGGTGRFQQRSVMRWSAAVARGRQRLRELVWGVRGGTGSTEQGVPWRCTSAGRGNGGGAASSGRGG